MKSPPYQFCWWCSQRFPAEGKYARCLTVDGRDVYTHACCVKSVKESQAPVSAAPRDVVPKEDP